MGYPEVIIINTMIHTLKLYSCLFKRILIVPDHDLGSHEPQEVDESVHMAQPDVSERTVFGILTDIEMERILEMFQSLTIQF